MRLTVFTRLGLAALLVGTIGELGSLPLIQEPELPDSSVLRADFGPEQAPNGAIPFRSASGIPKKGEHCFPPSG
jgi:hypothetical protein